MTIKLHLPAGIITALLFITAASAQEYKKTPATPMLASKNVLSNTINSREHSTLINAVKAAGLAGFLQSKGTITVFEPTNAAFRKLPGNSLEVLLKPENKEKMHAILTYHIVSGKWTTADIMAAIKREGGKTQLITVQGGKLTFVMQGKELWVVDENGGKAKITTGDVDQSNGVVHVIDTVLMHK